MRKDAKDNGGAGVTASGDMKPSLPPQTAQTPHQVNGGRADVNHKYVIMSAVSICAIAR